MRLPPVVLVAVCLLAGCGGPKPAAPAATPPDTASTVPSEGTPSEGADWPMYHGTPDHAGVSTTMPPAGTPRLVQSLKLDGSVYASPLVVHGLTIVATENDSVYAFDGSFRQVWKRSLGSPSPAEERQCGNIDPLGITGTPIYDASTDHIFAVAEHGGAVRHELYALDPASGSVAWTKSVDLPGVSARDMQQRARSRSRTTRSGFRTGRRPATAATTRAGSSACGSTAPATPSSTVRPPVVAAACGTRPARPSTGPATCWSSPRTVPRSRVTRTTTPTPS